MGYLTNIFIVLAFITVLHCAPIDESTVKPPGIYLSDSSTTASSVSTSTEQHTASKRQTIKDDSSSDSKESDESTEENKKRPAREDTENSDVLAHQAKQDSFGAIHTPPPVVTKEAPKHQLPARETREVHYDGEVPPGVHSGTFGTSSTTSSPSIITNKPH